MSSMAMIYLRLLRKIVRESAWRLGGSEERFLASGFESAGQAAVRRVWNDLPQERTGCARD